MLEMERRSGSRSDEAGSICRVSILVFRIAARQNHKGGIERKAISDSSFPSGIGVQSHANTHTSGKFTKLDWSDWFLLQFVR